MNNSCQYSCDNGMLSNYTTVNETCETNPDSAGCHMDQVCTFNSGHLDGTECSECNCIDGYGGERYQCTSEYL